MISWMLGKTGTRNERPGAHSGFYFLAHLASNSSFSSLIFSIFSHLGSLKICTPEAVLLYETEASPSELVEGMGL